MVGLLIQKRDKMGYLELREPIKEYIEQRYQFGGSNIPDKIPPGIMFVFEENGEPIAVDFLCPCGCGNSCYTPLKMNHPRRWEYSPGPTLSPSIRYTGGCKAHFFITNGKTIFCDDSGK